MDTMILAAAAQRLYNWAAAAWACNYNSASIIYICRILRWVLCLLLMYNYSWLASVISKLLVEEQKYPVVVLCTLIAELNHLLLRIDQLNLLQSDCGYLQKWIKSQLRGLQKTQKTYFYSVKSDCVDCTSGRSSILTPWVESLLKFSINWTVTLWIETNYRL